jgi:NTP pyrophosphatase (non-canonical NTP hydrolase)
MDTLRDSIINMMKKRDWSLHWIHRSAYLHLEAAELAEAVRGKHGDTLEESADVLITLLALSPHNLEEIIKFAEKKVKELEAKSVYKGETKA